MRVMEGKGPAGARRAEGVGIRWLWDGQMIDGAAQFVALQARYARLCTKYDQLVTKFAECHRPRNAAVDGWSLLRHSSMVLALFDTSGPVCGSDGFRRVIASARRHAPWRVVRASGRAARWSGSLEELLERESRRLLQRRRRRKRTFRIESVGHPRWLDAQLECDKVENEWRVSVFLNDVTDRIEAERRLAQVQAEAQRNEHILQMGVLAAGVAHDLKNVLHAMSLRVEDRTASTITMSALRRLVMQGSHMLTRVQEFAQRRERAARAIDLHTVIGDAIALVQSTVRHRALEAGVTITIDSQLSPVSRVVGDAAELRRVFVNLILNAADAMPSGGRIEIRTEDRGGLVMATVADDGQGIRESDLKRIFEPFFSTKGEGGTGLGLAIAREVVQRFGGTIGAGNRERGGAMFTVSLRRAAEESVRSVSLVA